MAITFSKLKVKNIHRETKEAITISFDVPENLKNEFKYLPGQYLTLKVFVDGEEFRRSYSICTSPVTNDDIAVTVKEVENGKVSSYLNNNLKVGDELDVMPPLGNFVVNLNAQNKKNYVLFGGGSGITPLMSMIESILKVEKESKIYLFYVNRNEDCVIYKDKLDKLQNEYKDRLNYNLTLTNPSYEYLGEKGRINKQKTQSYIFTVLKDFYKSAEYYLCGPVGMMDEVISNLLDNGVIKENIHKESFATGKKEEHIESNEQVIEGEVEEITVKIYGEEHKVKVEKGETVLISGMRASLDPPFSCQIGACSTCRARLKSGKVRMDDADALTDNEIKEGYILTCTSHPLTADVFVDYDD